MTRWVLLGLSLVLLGGCGGALPGMVQLRRRPAVVAAWGAVVGLAIAGIWVAALWPTLAASRG